MADRPYTGRKTVCELYKVCKRCKREKTWQEFHVHSSAMDKRNICIDCRNDHARKRYAANPETAIASAKSRAQRLKAQGIAKDVNRRYRKAQRARYLAAGLTINGTPRKKHPPSPEKLVADRLERQGIEFKKWLRHWVNQAAPEPCVAAWYTATGKPWNNPRLDVGQRFRVRYNADHEFRAKEILKAQLRKESRAKRIDELSDGSVTPQTLGALFGEAKYCVYCVEPFKDSYEKTADHVQPLYLGGAHSLHNLVICCRSCNSKKGKKGFLQWLTEAKPISNWLT